MRVVRGWWKRWFSPLRLFSSRSKADIDAGAGRHQAATIIQHLLRPLLGPLHLDPHQTF